MANYRIELNTQNWYCECCGSGAHFDITVFCEGERTWGTSRNDQFGGIYREGDDENVRLYDGWEDIIELIKNYLELLGHTVELELNIDATDTYYDWEEDNNSDWDEDESPYEGKDFE